MQLQTGGVDWVAGSGSNRFLSLSQRDGIKVYELSWNTAAKRRKSKCKIAASPTFNWGKTRLASAMKQGSKNDDCCSIHLHQDLHYKSADDRKRTKSGSISLCLLVPMHAHTSSFSSIAQTAKVIVVYLKSGPGPRHVIESAR